MKSKVGNPKLQAEALKLLQGAGIPVSIDYVAHNLGLSWSTARAILLQLALEKRITAQKTSKSWIFSIDSG